MSFLDRFQVILLDMNGTFMFGHDRFGPEEDFAATYHSLGGLELSRDEVESVVRTTCASMKSHYENPAKYDDFPRVADVLRELFPSHPDSERERLEDVIAIHELGRVPAEYSECLKQLSRTHRLGLVSNLWSAKTCWCVGFIRVSGVFLRLQEHQALPRPV